MADRDPLYSELEALGGSSEQPQQDPEVGLSETARQLQEEGYFDQLGRQFFEDKRAREQRAVEESQGFSESSIVNSVREFFNRPDGQQTGPRTQQGLDAIYGPTSPGRLSPEERQVAAQAELETAQGTAASARGRADAIPQVSPDLMGPGLMVPRTLLNVTRGLFNADAVKQENRLARAQAMVRGDAELPQYAEWRSLTESGAKTITDMFTTLPIQYAGIIGGYAPGVASNVLAGRPLDVPEFTDNRLLKFGQSVERAVQQAFPSDPARQFEYSHTLVQGLASTMAFGGQGAIAHLLGAGPKGQLALIALSGMAAQTPPEFERVTKALREGNATDRDRIIVVLANSALGATEALPFAGTIGAGRTGIAARMDRGFAQLGEETVQEAGQTSGQNITRLLTYDPNQDPYEGVLESMIVAAISGFGYGATFSGGGRQPMGETPIQQARVNTRVPPVQLPATATVPPAPAQPAAPVIPQPAPAFADPCGLERFAPAPAEAPEGHAAVIGDHS